MNKFDGTVRQKWGVGKCKIIGVLAFPKVVKTGTIWEKRLCKIPQHAEGTAEQKFHCETP